VIKLRRMGWVGHLVHVGRRKAYTGFCWGNLRERDHFGRHRLRLEDNIKMDLQEVGCGGMYWIQLAHDRDRWQALVNAVMNLWVP
jgi:hypothetical protein